METEKQAEMRRWREIKMGETSHRERDRGREGRREGGSNPIGGVGLNVGAIPCS